MTCASYSLPFSFLWLPKQEDRNPGWWWLENTVCCVFDLGFSSVNFQDVVCIFISNSAFVVLLLFAKSCPFLLVAEPAKKLQAWSCPCLSH